MNPFESLSDENHDQIKKYLRFFAQKKEGLLRTINIEFADAKADKLNGSMYSREDVEDFCEFLATAVKVRTSIHETNRLFSLEIDCVPCFSTSRTMLAPR
jgi:hypothetical protein